MTRTVSASKFARDGTPENSAFICPTVAASEAAVPSARFTIRRRSERLPTDTVFLALAIESAPSDGVAW